MQVEDGELKIIRPSLVYNYDNILLDKKDIHKILLKANINNKINDLKIWQIAFIHNSYSSKVKKNRKYTGFITNLKDQELTDDDYKDYSDCLQIQPDSNENLEWLGDSILKAITAAYLIKRYPSQDEGFRTRLRSKLERTEMLSKFAKHYGFEKYLVISKHIEDNCNGRNNLHILEDAFEAFIGAMYIDFGEEGKAYDICRKFVIKTLEDCVDFTDLIVNDDNYKDQLMRFYQKKVNGKFPIYSQELYDEDNKLYHMCVVHPLTNKVVGKGKVQSKKKAEQLSAKYALKFFEVIKDDTSSSSSGSDVD